MAGPPEASEQFSLFVLVRRCLVNILSTPNHRLTRLRDRPIRIGIKSSGQINTGAEILLDNVTQRNALRNAGD